MINNSVDALVRLHKQLESDDNDLLGEMVRRFAQELMSADADAYCSRIWRGIAGSGESA